MSEAHLTWPCGAGKGTLKVEVRYYDEKDTLLGMTAVDATMRGGGAGGDFNDALKEAAQTIANYTILKFK